ncbi:craniofacial development protein 2-like [Anneissia japonica]|uniref:craniofacial development protein 2-like n=1 Tax=Anneissia japonica TaxID=1529436 RepID=UPI0014257F62|nr:craniofacial development protein 2-like [Anneissia japonica]
MGDFNAKVRSKTHTQENSIGSFGIGGRNERGDRLIEFTESRNLKIMNTFFQKKPNRKWTWKSPNGDTKNKIDFILASNHEIVKDISVLAQFDTGSDHRLVRATIKINMRLERARLVRKKTPQLNLQNRQKNTKQPCKTSLTLCTMS